MSAYGVCAGGGAVAWELLQGLSDYCIGCDGPSYGSDIELDEDDEAWMIANYGVPKDVP